MNDKTKDAADFMAAGGTIDEAFASAAPVRTVAERHRVECEDARKLLKAAMAIVGRGDTTREERQKVARDLLAAVDAIAWLAVLSRDEYVAGIGALATGTAFADKAAAVKAAVKAAVGEKQRQVDEERRQAGGRIAKSAPTSGREHWFIRRMDPATLVALDKKVRMVDGVPEPGDPKPTLSNVVTILEEDPAVRGRIRFNAFTQLVEVDGMEKTEHLDTHVNLGLARVYGIDVPTDKIREALAYVGRRQQYDPLVDYLEGLVWDGVPRIGTVFATMFAVETPRVESEDGGSVDDPELLVGIERCFFVGAVARALKPGCKLDTMPIFIGKGGVGKSMGLAHLCPRPEWFCDTPFDMRDKDRFAQLDGVWLYEFAELHTLSTASLNATKAYMSSASDKYRRPYDRTAQQHPRRCAPVGSSNDPEIGKDRRFHPLDVRPGGVVDVAGIAAIRDQLWAEAVVLFRAGTPWNLSRGENARLLDHAEKYRVTSPWEAEVAAFLEREVAAWRSRSIETIPHFGIEQVIAYLKIPVEKSAEQRVLQGLAHILSEAGCRKGRPRHNGKRSNRWFLPGVDPAGF